MGVRVWRCFKRLFPRADAEWQPYLVLLPHFLLAEHFDGIDLCVLVPCLVLFPAPISSVFSLQSAHTFKWRLLLNRSPTPTMHTALKFTEREGEKDPRADSRTRTCTSALRRMHLDQSP